jgi:hypothetical protein
MKAKKDYLLECTSFLFLFLRTPPRQSHFLYPPLLGKPRTRVKCLLHTDRIILRLHWRAGPKELFAPKGIQTSNFIGLQQRQRPLPLEPTPGGYLNALAKLTK